ncbi:MAG: FAD-dependent oxidoreductase, partial [Coriobacteriales bacterium]
MNPDSKLFQPIKVGKVTLKNRFEVAPYGSGLHERDCSAGQKLMEHLKNVARGGACMATIGSGDINKDGQAGVPIALPANPMLIGNYNNISEMMHQFDCKISMQLFGGKEMLTPSEVIANEYTKDDLARWRDEYADAAFNMMQAGFDFIMIHGAHGNGPSMLFSRAYNHRTDEYGGSLENRARFALEVLDAIRDKCGDGIGIEYRLSAEEMIENGATLEENIEFAKLIQDRIDILHISRGLLEETEQLPYVFTPTYFPRGINVEFAKKFKDAVNVPVAVVGGANLELAQKIVDEDKADIVAAARNFIADPLCMTKATRGQEDQIRPCIRCNTCIGQTHARLWDIRCSVNPLCGREVDYPTYGLPAAKSKKVVLIGGGPANMQFARTAAKRGHKVVLFEREKQLGGKLVLATKTDFKADLKRYLDWSIRMVEQEENIDVRLGVSATRELVAAENPDAVVVAIGGDPIVPHFTASGTDKVIWVGEAEERLDQIGNDVIVAGGGLTGLEAALEFAQNGKQVRVVDMIPESALGKGGTLMNVVGLMQLLHNNGVQFICDTKIIDIDENGMTVEDS